MASQYTTLLREKICSLIRKNALEFCDIVEQADGAYPTDVLLVLNTLLGDGIVKKVNSRYYLSENTEISKPKKDRVKNGLNKDIEEKICQLSDPHPADYDWRFTADTVRRLIVKLNTNNTEKKVALFGTTTLFPTLKDNRSNVILFNKSKSLVNDLKLMGYSDGLYEHDLFKPINFVDDESYDYVVADPPWYLDFYKAFIARASTILRIDGLLLLSVLPPLTRPGAIDDQNEIIQFCKNYGLEKVDSINGFLTYHSPRFESKSLKNLGICCNNWRKGDLYFFIKRRRAANDLSLKAPDDEPLWHEININKRKFKIREQANDSKDFSFRLADETKILSSVSRRSPLRNKIDFWTSDNFAFSVDNSNVLLNVLRLLELNQNRDNAIKEVCIKYQLKPTEILKLSDLLNEVGL